MDSTKADSHANKIDMHNKDHVRHVEAKNGRLERHSGTGHSVKEGPKKGGKGGKGNWGSYMDDVQDL